MRLTTPLVSLATALALALASPWAQVSSAADQPPVVPLYLQCTSDSDCTIRNVGNCCGDYPRCANRTAALPPPCPGGGVGVCGFPHLDGCECGSRGGCMGLQGGNVVQGQEYQGNSTGSGN